MPIPNSIAFSIFGRDVRWYGILIACALVLGMFISLKRSEKKGIKNDDIMDFFIFLVPSIIIGARLYYVVFEWGYYSKHLSEIIAVWNGGLAIHGGIIAGVIVGILVCKVKKINFWKLGDTVIPALPLGQAIGRWGNYFNMEAYGSETTLPWAITVKNAAGAWIQVHPTFLYESIWDLLLFGFLLVFEKKWQQKDGELLFVYMIFYSLGRFFIEGLRTDSLMFLGLRVAQLISLALIIGGGVGLYVLRKKKDTPPRL